jgi:HJR/Mrr/RecB family endonuclease
LGREQLTAQRVPVNVLPHIPYRRSLHRLLVQLTLIGLVIYAPLAAVLLYQGRLREVLHWLFNAPAWLPMLVVLHGFILLAGWSAVAYVRWHTWREAVAERLLARSVAELHAMSPEDFEAFVAQAFRAQGFRVWNTRYAVDHGVDLQLITPEGTPAVAQVKRYRKHVGESAVRDLAGTMLHAGAQRGYLVSTGGFSRPARKWAKDKAVTLIDGRQLLRMNRHAVWPAA